MLVSEYFDGYVQTKRYKYQTKINMVRCLKKLELWDMDYEDINPSLVWERIEQIINQNVKRCYSGYMRNIFDYTFDQIPVVMGISRTYDLPSQKMLHEIIESTKYKNILFLCMYAGLRIGEACAVVPDQVQKDGNHYWLNVDRAFSQDGMNLSSPKTLGKVLIPEWVAQMILSMKKEDYWKKGMPTKLVTNACQSLGHTQKVSINPHMLRHWFATDMVHRGIPVNVIMKQMRHKSINTTMQVYAQVNKGDFIDALPNLPLDEAV